MRSVYQTEKVRTQMGTTSKKMANADIFEIETPTVDMNALDDEAPDFEVLEKEHAKTKAQKTTRKTDVFETEEVEEAEEEGIASLITDIDDKVEYLTWCIYGKNGTGKTTLLSTTDGMLVLAAEDGTLSIRDKSKGIAKKLRIDTWEKLEQVYWLLNEGKRVVDKSGKVIGIKINVKGGTFIVKTLGFDTIDRLVEVCMRNVVLGEREKDADKDILKKTLKNWGDMGEKLKFWLQQFEELPLQRVYLCQEASNSEDVDADEFSIYPALNQSVRKYVMSEADIIARLYLIKGEKGQTTFKLSALPNSKYVTKDRTTKLSGTVTNPSLDKLYNAVFK